MPIFEPGAEIIGHSGGDDAESSSRSVRGLKFCFMNYSSKVNEYNKPTASEEKDFSELVDKLVSPK
jgi:hypothetical protein